MCDDEKNLDLGNKYLARVWIENWKVISANSRNDIVYSYLLEDETGIRMICEKSMVYGTKREAIIALIKQLITELQ